MASSKSCAEEMAEVRHALAEKDSKKAEEELGDLLFAAVNLARFVRVDPEIALKKANGKFKRRFMEMEKPRHRAAAPSTVCLAKTKNHCGMQ